MSKKQNESKKKGQPFSLKDPDYLWSMSHAPKIDESTQWVQMIPIAFFTAVVIMIARMYSYTRPMDQFFWSNNTTSLTEFFSFFKMVAICVCAGLALFFLLCRLLTQTMFIKRSYAYIPMIVYVILVLLSYAFSDYKEFAWLGWNERFEGTLTLLAYMIMLFFIINSVNTEKNVKWIIYPLAVTSGILSLLGISQALDKDFFRTALGQKLLVPNQMTEQGLSTWNMIDQLKQQGENFLNFTFMNKEIYQTVYNINYVSFYLTLLIPLFGMIFIHSVMKGKECPIWKKIIWGVLFAVLVFNIIGSASSGGLLGLLIVVLIGIIVLNKRILQWWKPVVVLVVITLIVSGLTYERWLPEFAGAVNGVLGKQVISVPNKKDQDVLPKDNPDIPSGTAVGSTDGAATAEGEKKKATPTVAERHYIDYIETSGMAIIFSIEGNKLTFNTMVNNDPTMISVLDPDGQTLQLRQSDDSSAQYGIADERFDFISIRPALDEEKNYYIVIVTDGHEWLFRTSHDGVKYFTGTGKLIDLHQVPAFGFENNQSFGSGRGYIWSRTLPMLKDTILLGHGADTYCIYYPHEDYVGKYNSGTFSGNVNIIVDKPHNMYLGAAVGTGCLSVIALLVLWGIYIVQSFRLYWREKFSDFTSFTGAGIFFGICGFLVSGIVNDSTVSVMPMFYGLLGTGIAINMILKRQMKMNVDSPDTKEHKVKNKDKASSVPVENDNPVADAN